MSFYQGLDTALQNQIKKIKVKKPADFWMRLDNSFFSLNRGNVLLFKLGEQLKEMQNNLPKADQTKKLETALANGSDLTASINDFYDNYHTQIETSFTLIKKYRIDNWWFNAPKKAIDHYSKTFVYQAYVASVQGIFQAIEQKLSSPLLTSQQLSEYEAGIDLIYKKLKEQLLIPHYSIEDKNQFMALLDTANTMQKKIATQIGIITGVQEITHRLTEQANKLTDKAQELQDYQYRLKAVQKNIELLQAKSRGQEQYKAALDSATNKKKVIEDTIQYALGAITQVVDKNVLTEKDTKQNFERNSAEYQAYLDFIDALLKKPSRDGGRKIQQLMRENSYDIAEAKHTAQKYFKKYINIVSMNLKAIKQDKANLSKSDYKSKLKSELGKLTFMLTGLVRMYGMKDYKELFSTPCEQHGCQFMKHQNDYNYGKRNMLAYACSTLYQHFKTWVDDRIKTAPVTNNISVIAQTGPKSTQIRSKPTLFNGNDQHKATLESIVAQQAQQQRGFAIN